MLVPDERKALLAWVKNTSHSSVVINDSKNVLVSIKDLSIRQISVTALRLFCVHHQISGYKNKSKEVTCMLIMQWTKMKAICDVMYHQPLKESSRDDEGSNINNNSNNNKNGVDTANFSLSVNANISGGEESKNEEGEGGGGGPCKKKEEEEVQSNYS